MKKALDIILSYLRAKNYQYDNRLRNKAFSTPLAGVNIFIIYPAIGMSEPQTHRESTT